METANSEPRQTRWVILLLVILGLLTQWPVLPTFKADDYPAIAYASDWSRVAHDFVGPQYDLRFFLFYRPLITLSLAVDHLFFGVEPFGFLAMNSLACIGSALLLFGIFRRLLVGKHGETLAGGLAAFWLVHPVLLHSTSWVVGRVDTHVAFWILLSLWFHLGRRRGGPAWPVWTTLILAFMTKEYALGAPLLLLGLDMVDPRRVDGPGLRLCGKRLLALPYLVLIPAFLLLRKRLLGAALGGYGFLEGQSLDAFAVAEGIWSTLSYSLLPAGPAWLRTLAMLLLVIMVITLIWKGAEGRTARLVGALLLSAGLFAPLTPLLPSMRDPGQQRYAYLAVLWPWIVVFMALYTNPRLMRWSWIVLLPLLLSVVKGRQVDMNTMRGNDLFVRSLVESLHTADEIRSPENQPLLLTGQTEASFHPQRFLWGLGSVLKPPFHKGKREVLSLRKLHPLAMPVGADFFDKGMPGLIAIDSKGASSSPWQHWDLEPLPKPIAPSGFNGVLRPVTLDELNSGEHQGWKAGPGYEGRVAVCTGFGSFLLPLPAENGMISLAALLLGNVSYSTPGAKNLVLDILWNGFDLARESPISLYWKNHAGLQRAELRVSPDYPAWYWGLHR